MSIAYQNGVMPTNEWFNEIKEHVKFNGKTVLDVGCAEGVMCLLSLKEGAKSVNGIDEQMEMIERAEKLTEEYSNVLFIHGKTKDKIMVGNADIGIFSMIIHWIGMEEFLRLTKCFKTIVVIFRERNPGYQIPINGKWFPTLQELHSLMKEKGFRRNYSEVIMVQDSEKRISLAIYDKEKR